MRYQSSTASFCSFSSNISIRLDLELELNLGPVEVIARLKMVQIQGTTESQMDQYEKLTTGQQPAGTVPARN
jgi:hypothetical protein